MIMSFRHQGTEDVYDGLHSKAARKVCPMAIWPVARRKLDQLDVAILLQDLTAPPANRLERLTGDRADQHSIRINQQYRIFSFGRRKDRSK